MKHTFPFIEARRWSFHSIQSRMARPLSRLLTKVRIVQLNIFSDTLCRGIKKFVQMIARRKQIKSTADLLSKIESEIQTRHELVKAILHKKILYRQVFIIT